MGCGICGQWSCRISHVIACYRMLSHVLTVPWNALNFLAQWSPRCQIVPRKSSIQEFQAQFASQETVPDSGSLIFGTAQLVFESCSRCSCYAAKAWRRSVGQLRWARNGRQLPLQFSPQNLLAEFETSHSGFEAGQAGKSWQELARAGEVTSPLEIMSWVPHWILAGVENVQRQIPESFVQPRSLNISCAQTCKVAGKHWSLTNQDQQHTVLATQSDRVSGFQSKAACGAFCLLTANIFRFDYTAS